MLEAGAPILLQYIYAALIAVNATSIVVAVLRGKHHSAFMEVVVDSVYVVAWQRAVLLVYHMHN